MCTATGGVRYTVHGAREVMKCKMVKNLCRIMDTVPGGVVFTETSHDKRRKQIIPGEAGSDDRRRRFFSGNHLAVIHMWS